MDTEVDQEVDRATLALRDQLKLTADQGDDPADLPWLRDQISGRARHACLDADEQGDR